MTPFTQNAKLDRAMRLRELNAKIEKLKTATRRALDGARSTADLEVLKVKVLGRKGELSRLYKALPKLTAQEKPGAGKLLNELKAEFTNLLETQRSMIKAEKKAGTIDVTLPGRKYYIGNLHPINRIYREMNEIMVRMGFSIYDGPHIETDFVNFEALNLPKNHPARDLQDTVYIKSPEVLLRSQTSSLEVRAMLEEKLPIRIVVPGVCFRKENPNVNNHFYFHQYEALAIGEGITMAHLKGLSEVFFKELMGQDTVLRFRCKYYPQVEPGVGIDIQCKFCHGKPGGCVMCKHRGWVEAAGAGMVHVNALKACGIDPEKYTGFAWGVGTDRMAMQKYGIKDIRDLYNGNLVYS